MRVLNVEQGSERWKAERRNRFTASEAPIMMGVSPYMTRDQLLHMKATGIEPEIDAATQRRFDDGHRTEALARAITERLIGEELYPATGVHEQHDWLLASYDGITMFEDDSMEHKLWSEGLAAKVRSGEVKDDPFYYWQLEQQCFVAGLKGNRFIVSDGTEINREECIYTPVPGRIEKLLAGWAQFREDLEEYKRKLAAGEIEQPAVAVVANSIESLPAIAVNVTGSLAVKSNLDEFERQAMAFIGGIKTDLETDQDFADAEAMVKFCDKTEKELDAVKQNVLGQVADIDAAMRMIDRVKGEMRTRRLALDKQVKAQKQTIRDNIVLTARRTLDDHIARLHERIGSGVIIPEVYADFAGAIKGKKTIESLRSAANDELARAKIEASEIADKIEANLKALKEEASGYGFLFRDIQQIILKDREDLLNLAKQRIAEHKAEEERKLEAERERIRQEEQRRAEAEQAERDRIAAAQATEAPAEPEKHAGDDQAQPEEVKQSPSVVPLAKKQGQKAAGQPKTLMEDVASWCDAWRIPVDASGELVAIIESHMPGESIRKA